MTLAELLPLVAVVVVFWFLFIRPAGRRRKEQARLVASLAPGQQVMTTAGVFGTVEAIEGDRVHLRIAPGVVIEILAQAIAQAAPTAVELRDDSQDAPAQDSPETASGIEADPRGEGAAEPGREAERG